jgi:hypothetical protein
LTQSYNYLGDGFRGNRGFCRKLVQIAENCDQNIKPWDNCSNFGNVPPKKIEKIGENHQKSDHNTYIEPTTGANF